MKFEYTVLFVSENTNLLQLTKELNECGERGWEVVAYAGHRDYIILKREKA